MSSKITTLTQKTYKLWRSASNITMPAAMATFKDSARPAIGIYTRLSAAASSPLLSAPNCVITPHIAWAPKESRQRILDQTLENVRAYLAGAPVNVVNL